MELRQLELFVAVAEAGHFTRAATAATSASRRCPRPSTRSSESSVLPCSCAPPPRHARGAGFHRSPSEVPRCRTRQAKARCRPTRRQSAKLMASWGSPEMVRGLQERAARAFRRSTLSTLAGGGCVMPLAPPGGWGRYCHTAMPVRANWCAGLLAWRSSMPGTVRPRGSRSARGRVQEASTRPWPSGATAVKARCRCR